MQVKDITKSKGKIKVHLGGGVEQTIIVEITDLILNRGTFLSWPQVTNIVKKAVSNVFNELSTDFKLICFNKSS